LPRRVTKEEWVERIKSIWGNTYDYSKVEYKKAKDPIWVICPKDGHGGWETTLDNHTSKRKPRGCPECGGSKRKTFDLFKEQARKIHGSRYSYPEQIYKNAFTKVRIICPVHGDFSQSPDSHLGGSACPDCGKERSREQNFLTEGDVNYRLLENCMGDLPKVHLVPGSYKGMNSKASIVCEVHGEQKPRLMTSVFSSPHPCLVCADTLYTKGYSTECFVEILKREFGDQYEISKFSYEGRTTEITLVCPKKDHGEFTLQAGSIYRSPGCPICAYQESLPTRREAWVKKAETTREYRKKDWLEKSRSLHGGFFDYSEVIYKDAHTPVLIGCPIHGFRSQTPSVHLRSGCRLCADEELKGLYSEQYFRKHPEEKRKLGLLYYVRFKCDDEVFYKVGITQTTVANRFSATPRDRVSVGILGTKRTTIYDAWICETEIQNTHGEKYRYRPLLGGANPRDYRIGPSECFSHELNIETRQRYFGEVVRESNHLPYDIKG